MSSVAGEGFRGCGFQPSLPLFNPCKIFHVNVESQTQRRRYLLLAHNEGWEPQLTVLSSIYVDDSIWMFHRFYRPTESAYLMLASGSCAAHPICLRSQKQTELCGKRNGTCRPLLDL